MKIFIASYGSRGDVQPYIALGRGLKDAGHHVTLATSDRFRDFVIDNQLQYGYMNDDLMAILDTDQGHELLENTNNLFQVILRTFSMMKQLGPMQRSLLRDSWEAAREFAPDLIIFHPKAYGGPLFAEKLGIPVIMALPFPMLVPTAEHPNMGFPDLKIGGWYNRMTYRLVNILMGWSAGKHVRAWRKMHGLKLQKKFDILHTADGKNIPVLHGVSQYLLPRPSDWPETASITGYWFLRRNSNWTAMSQLEEFINAGAAPIYIGFGSMAGRNPERLTKVVINTLKNLGMRGVIASGWGGLKADELPESIMQIEQAAHDWLFPRMAVIVHHGGAGTTAACLRAGKPSIVVPFFGDQPFWGNRVYQLGLGSKPIPQKKLTIENLTNAIQEVCSNPQIQRKAADLGEKIRQEDGVGNAVSIVERILRNY